MNQIDFDFVLRQLDASRTKSLGAGKSGSGRGVRIGESLELASITPAQLRRLGLPVSLQRKLAPFIGKSGAELAASLRWQPLRLSSSDRAAVLSMDSRATIRRLESRYIGGAANRSRRSLGSLPPAAQTVLAVLALKHGVDLDRRLPSVWQAFCAQKWSAARAAMESEGSANASVVGLLSRLV